MNRLLVVALVVLLLAGCSGDRSEEKEDLREVRDEVVADAKPLVEGLLGRLPATLKASVGQYVSCQSSLDGQPTAFSFEVAAHLSLDHTPGTPDFAVVAEALQDAGFTLEDERDGLLEARKGKLTALAQDTPGAAVIRLKLSHGGCFEVGKQREGEFRESIPDILG